MTYYSSKVAVNTTQCRPMYAICVQRHHFGRNLQTLFRREIQPMELETPLSISVRWQQATQFISVICVIRLDIFSQ